MSREKLMGPLQIRWEIIYSVLSGKYTGQFQLVALNILSE
jgi:hypothetical protein